MGAREGADLRSPSRTSLQRTSDRELVLERTFNGPARIVFEAWTRADMVSRWWAPRSLGVTAVRFEADVRVGGPYRYVLRHRKGNDFAFSGTYTEVTPYSRLVYTSFFEPEAVAPAPDTPAVVVTVTFDERDGRTHLVSREWYPSKEVLDGALASGMEQGVHLTMDQLDELVASLA